MAAIFTQTKKGIYTLWAQKIKIDICLHYKI